MINYPLQYSWASLVAQLVENLPAVQETWVWSLGWEDPLEKGKATHFSILAWRIPWTVYSMGSQRVRHSWATLIFTFIEEWRRGVSGESDWFWVAAAAAKSLQSRPTLWDPIDGSPPGFPVPGILQARTLEWVAISFSNAWKWKVKVKSLSRVWLSATSWTAAYQAPPSMGFARQEYWSEVPLPSPSEYKLDVSCKADVYSFTFHSADSNYPLSAVQHCCT